MSNKLWEIFNPDSDLNKQFKIRTEKMKQDMYDDKHCMYCVHNEQIPHIEMGKNGGSDDYCNIFQKYTCYNDGFSCLFWYPTEEAKEKYGK